MYLKLVLSSKKVKKQCQYYNMLQLQLMDYTTVMIGVFRDMVKLLHMLFLHTIFAINGL